MKKVTVIVPTHYSKCTRHNKIYIGCNEVCYIGGKPHATVQMKKELKWTQQPECIAKFLVRYNEARIVK